MAMRQAGKHTLELIAAIACLILYMSVYAYPGPEDAGSPLDSEFMTNKSSSLSVTILIGSQSFRASFYDNPTSRSLIEQMPFTVELEDYAGLEKIFYPEPPLNEDGAPKGAEPSAGDITYYAPWDDVAIFYKDYSYASGLIPMGRIEDITAFTKALDQEGPAVTFTTENKQN